MLWLFFRVSDGVALFNGTSGKHTYRIHTDGKAKDGFVLIGKHLPVEAYPHLVNGIRHQLLHMEGGIDEHHLWEHRLHSQHHGGGQVHRHGLYPAAKSARNSFPIVKTGSQPFPSMAGCPLSNAHGIGLWKAVTFYFTSTFLTVPSLIFTT